MNDFSGSGTSLVFDVNADNLRSDVLEASLNTPIVLVFWAEWEPSCKTQLTVLNTVAQEYAGKFRVAQLNVEDADPQVQGMAQQLVAQLGIRSIPALVLIHEGKPVQVLAGLQDEAAIRTLLKDVTMSPAERIQLEVEALIAAGENQQALALLQQILAAEPDNIALQVTQAKLLLQLGRIDDARMLINALPADAPGLQQPRAKLAFLDMASDLEPRNVLEQQLAAQPDNLDAIYQMAIHHVLADNDEAACELLLQIVSKDRSFKDDGARLLMLKVFEQKGSADPMVRRYRNRLFSLMH